MVLRAFNCTLCAASNAKTLIKKTLAAERQIHQLTDTTISITINRQRKQLPHLLLVLLLSLLSLLLLLIVFGLVRSAIKPLVKSLQQQLIAVISERETGHLAFTDYSFSYSFHLFPSFM